jgi:hypothetical protein
MGRRFRRRFGLLRFPLVDRQFFGRPGRFYVPGLLDRSFALRLNGRGFFDGDGRVGGRVLHFRMGELRRGIAALGREPFDSHRRVLVNRAGVRLLFGDAHFWQEL